MKTKTITITLLLATLVTSLNLTAQDQPTPSKVKEVGIGLASLNYFSLQYRWGSENRLFRISGNIGGTTSSENATEENTGFGYPELSGTTKTTSPITLICGLSFSILKIKSVSEKLGILYGGIVAFSYLANETITDKVSYNIINPSITTITKSKQNDQTFQPSLGISVGAVYKINSSFLLYAEIDPNIYYAYSNTLMNSTIINNDPNSPYTRTGNSTSSKSTFGLANLANSGASLTIVYRLTN